MPKNKFSDSINPVEKPKQFEIHQFPEIGTKLVEVDKLISYQKARGIFDVSGKGLTVAVIDSGLRTTHIDFRGRVLTQYNFTDDNNGNPGNANDNNGHGTHVAGIISANKIHIGVAPGAGIIPLKVLDSTGGGSFNSIIDALEWIIKNKEKYNVSVVNMSLGDSGNYIKDDIFESSKSRKSIIEKIKELYDNRIPIVVSAGNDYKQFGSEQGMCFPAIVRETISVSAVFDENIGKNKKYGGGAIAYSTEKDRITPFSQRLHENTNEYTRTDIFAPGAPVMSSGINNDEGESIQNGTSQATPVITGVILLIQEYYKKITNELPDIESIIECLRNGGVKIYDGDDEDDNVGHTNEYYYRVDAVGALTSVRSLLKNKLLVGSFKLK